MVLKLVLGADGSVFDKNTCRLNFPTRKGSSENCHLKKNKYIKNSMNDKRTK